MSAPRAAKPETRQRLAAQQIDGGSSFVKGYELGRDDDGAQVKSARKARGAEPGPSVRNVLVWSLGLVVAAFAVVYFLFFKT
jgi:hypothetical protein